MVGIPAPEFLISRIFSSREIAATCASACRPVPMTPRTISFFGERYLQATAPAAPVRMSVRRVALITAVGLPVAISRITVRAITVGRPCGGLPGWTFTIFTPAIPSEGRYTGMVRKSPSGSVMYTLGGIWTCPLPWSANADSTARLTRPISSPMSVSVKYSMNGNDR